MWAATPVVAARGDGSRLFDVDGNEYIDFVLSWGPLVLGHAPPAVLDALEQAMAAGTSFGMPTELELRLGELIRDRMPHLERLRFVSSGTEATMSAVRVARAHTKRDGILKFDGCYHGHADSFLVRAGSGVATLGLPNSPGVPAALAELTFVAPYNDVAAVERLMAERGPQVAAIIVEPVVGNAGFIPPDPEFLPALRRLADAHGALLDLRRGDDRFPHRAGRARRSASASRPDLTTLGKVIGGGLPVAAYGGRADLMDEVAPAGPVYQAGTLSGNPLAMAAGLATLTMLTPALHARIERRTARLVQGMREIAARQDVPFTADHAGSMWGFFFRAEPVRNFADARTSDTDLFKRFFHEALARGVYLAPSPFEAGFMSAAHSDEDIAAALDRMDAALGAARG